MLKTIITNKHESTYAACDRCGKECPGSRQFAVDGGDAIGWNGGMALATVAHVRGWIRRLEGRMQREYCPACAAKIT